MAETKRAARRAAQRAVAVALSAVMVVAYCVPAEALAEAAGAGEATDIAAEWSEGAMTISEGGRYTLSEDVETDGTLTVLAGEGETVEVDLAGHSVEVEGDVFAGVDASGSLGSVVIRDSEFNPEGGEASGASISVTAERAEDAVAGVLANYELPEGEDGEGLEAPSLELEGVSVGAGIASVDGETADEEHDAYAGYADEDDPRGELDVSLEGVSVAAEVVSSGSGRGGEALDEDSVGVAYGVYATAPGVALDGSFASDTSSDELDCGLYSTVEGAFRLGTDFELGEETRVFAAGNEPGTVFADAAEGLEDADDFLGLLVDGSGEGNVLEFSGGELVFAEAPVDEGLEAGEASEGAADGEGASSQTGSGDEDGDGGEEAKGDGEVGGPVSTLSSLLESFLSGAGSALSSLTVGDDGEEAGEGSSAVWSVAGASGEAVGSYGSFDEAEEAVEDGGTITLEEDASGVEAVFDGKSSGSYTLDLAGHALGGIAFECSAGLSVLSSEEGGEVDGSAGGCGISAEGAGDLRVEGVSVVSGDGGGETYVGVSLVDVGSAELIGVSIEAEALGGGVVGSGATGLFCSDVGSLSLEGCDVSACATSESASGSAIGASLAGTAASLEGSSFSAEGAGSQGASGLEAWASSEVEASGCSFSGSSEAGLGFALSADSSSGVSLGSGCSFSGSTADLDLAEAVTLLSGFESADGVAVYSDEPLEDGEFAELEEGLDGESLAEAFEPAEGSCDEGSSAAASGGSLV